MVLRGLAQKLYDNTVRDHLPRKVKVYNGVSLNTGRLLDTNVVSEDYKQGTIDPLRELTRPDDSVVVVGGGHGVTAVVAARQGESVVVYEGGRELAERVRETARLNRVDDRIDVRHAIVAEGKEVYGDETGSTVVSPADLEECDVLELDCEGAEEPILKGMTIRPRVIIVETHPGFGVDPTEIRSLVTGWGYTQVHEYEFKENVTFAFVRDEATA
ncbi:FkbM family methyltransferase [Haloarchaeobius baliensis]|uniref:FkbM family methyltransferase n=1 Tax=Haloarchaeobius baliensis TaxID=1670458 RepID=UPI003F8835B7